MPRENSGNARLFLVLVLEEIEHPFATWVFFRQLRTKEDLCVLVAAVRVAIVPHQWNRLLDLGQVHRNILYQDDHPVIVVVHVGAVGGQLLLQIMELLLHLANLIT